MAATLTGRTARRGPPAKQFFSLEKHLKRRRKGSAKECCSSAGRSIAGLALGASPPHTFRILEPRHGAPAIARCISREMRGGRALAEEGARSKKERQSTHQHLTAVGSLSARQTRSPKGDPRGWVKQAHAAATHSGSGSRSKIMQPVIGGKTSALEDKRRERPRSAAASHGTHGWRTITAGGADVWCRPAALMLLQSHTKWVLIYIMQPVSRPPAAHDHPLGDLPACSRSLTEMRK